MMMLVRVSLVLLSWFCMGSKGQLLDYENWADQAALSGGLCRYGNSVECCWGWRQADRGRCQPHCQQGCKHGECVGPERCKCHPGYTGKACNQDLNECGLKPRPCKHRCMNTPGSYKCYCLDGYTLQPDGSCRNARTCYHANCQYGCEVIKGAVRCTCPSPGLQLGPDRRTCIDIDECVSDGGVCPRRRKCVNTFGSFVCNCHLGFKLLYINGRYTCVDKDTRPFCSLNPSSPKCRCKDGNCKAPPKVTLEPQRPKTTPVRTTTPPTTTATTTPPTTTTTTTTPPTTTTTTPPTTTTTTPPTTTTTTTPFTTTTTTTPPTTTTTTTPPTTTTTTSPPTTTTTTPPTTTTTTTPPTTMTTTTITTTPPTTTTTTTTTTPAAPTSTAAATSPLATTTTTTTTAPPTTTATTTMTTKAATTTPKAATPTPATTALAATTTFVTTTSPSSTPSTTSTATPTFITTTPTVTTSTSTTLPTTTKLDATTPTSPTPPPPPDTATFTTTSPTITTSTSTTQPTITELDTTTTTTPAPPTPAAPTTTTTTTVAPTTVMLTTVSLVTTSTNNKVKLRGDVHIPRHPNHNHVWEFDIELGNTGDYARDDPQVGLLQCTFDHGVCDWMSDREGDLHWETTHRPAGGWYLSVPELKAGQKSVRGARLAVQIGTSWSRDVVCFSFSHWLTGHHVGVLQLFVRAKGRNQRYSTALWSRTGGHGWRHTQVTLTTHSVDRVLLKAERRQGRRGLIAVDNVTLRQGACR